MAQQQTAARVFVCFDANLPKLVECRPDCENEKKTLCVHRFDQFVQTEHCNTGRFHGWSDLRILMYFFGRILERIADGSVTRNSIFIILTKDSNFIEDVKSGWAMVGRNDFVDLEFFPDRIECCGFTIFIEQVDCRNYGHNRGDDLRCAFLKVKKKVAILNIK